MVIAGLSRIFKAIPLQRALISRGNQAKNIKRRKSEEPTTHTQTPIYHITRSQYDVACITPQVWSMQYNLAYNVTGHNVCNTTNWAIMLQLQSSSPGPSEQTLVWQFFLFAYIKIK